MRDTDLCYLSATEALRAFGAHELSPRELLEALLSRVEAVEPHINAFADRYVDEALTLARAAEARYQRGENTGPLDGLPLAVKDDAQIAGRRTTFGSLVYENNVCTRTDPHVQRLLDAGAIVHARTTCSEFCAAWVTYTRLYGVTRCPWNRDYTPGGSSGGSAAAVAAGTTTLAVGSDNAGSIRQPASLCGVVGYKPPHGRNPLLAPAGLDSYWVVGPLTRTVADAALMQNVMSGPHPEDIASWIGRVRLELAPGGIRGWRIAYSPDLDYFAVDPDVRHNLMAVVAALEAEGASVEPVELGWTEEIKMVCMEHYQHYYGVERDERAARHRDLLTDYSVYYARTRVAEGLRDYGRVVKMAARMFETLGRVLDDYQAFICPTVAVPSIPAEMGPDQFLDVEGRKVDADFGWCMTYPFNMLGQLPVLAVPSGISSLGVPTGVQIVARPNDDARVFRVGAAVERSRPWSYKALSGLA